MVYSYLNDWMDSGAACRGVPAKEYSDGSATPTARTTAGGESWSTNAGTERGLAPRQADVAPMMPPVTLKATASATELQPDIARARADRPAEADLPGPLGHRQQHDVHDPDAADQQRHRRNAASSAVIVRLARSIVFRELLERHLFESRRRCRRRRARRPAACRLWPAPARLRGDGEVVRVRRRRFRDVRSSFVMSRDSRHLARRRGGDRDVVELATGSAAAGWSCRALDGVELIVAGAPARPSSSWLSTTPTTRNG